MRVILLTLFSLFFYASSTQAHQVDSVELELLRDGEKWKLEGLLDIAYMLPESRGVEGAPPLFRKDVMVYPQAKLERITRESERTMRRLLILKYNGAVVSWNIRFPELEKDKLVLPPDPGDWALLTAEISIPSKPGPGKLEAYWNDDQESALIIIIDEGTDLGLLSISSGMSETLLSVAAPVAGQDAISQETSALPTRNAQAWSWVISGFRHVIPLGLDHLLFIIGLFLLAPRWKPLLGQSLTFTVAHSITLALAIFGFITLPSILIEILIAASIAWIGIENLIVRKLKPSRLYLVFGFGLLHGLGFASVLKEKLGSLTGQQVAMPLVSFNIGVELAQITVIIISFVILMPLQKWTKQVQIIGSIIVALAGLFWMSERILSIFPAESSLPVNAAHLHFPNLRV
ncbi:MAG: HupE/UreJ family protein [Akkermansiaceae bacterium]